MRRALRWGLPALLAVLLVADTALWWWATGRMLGGLAQWQAQQRAAGLVVQAGTPARGGWPLRAALSVPDVLVASAPPGQADALVWQAARLLLRWEPWAPERLVLLPEGAQTLRWAAAPPIQVQADRLEAVVALRQGSVTLDAHGLAVAGAQLEAGSLRLQAAAAQLALSGLSLPGHLPFGDRVSWLDANLRSTTPLPPLSDPAAALAAWRLAGGQLVLDGLSLRWGALELSGHATLGLDAAGQPQGEGLLRWTAYHEALDVLARAGLVTPGYRLATDTVLGMLATHGADGTPQAELPFTARDGRLSVGNIPLAKLPVLAPALARP